MPDDWKDGVRDIVDEWGLELSDTIAKDTNEEFIKRISTMGVEMNLVQTEALDKLILNDVAFISKTNKQIGESIISDVEKLLIEKGDWASAKEAVLKHVEDVFSGEEKIVINNIGKTSKRVFVDTALGHAVIKEVTVQRAWSGNIQAYSDMVAKSLSQKARQMGDIEAYRMTNGIVGWRRMSSLSGRTCNICASLHGRAYYFSGVGYNGMPDDDGMMFEPHPNGYCYQVPIYDEWTGIKNRSDDMLDADLDSWKIQNEHSMSNLVRVGQMPTDTVQTDFALYVLDDISLQHRDSLLSHRDNRERAILTDEKGNILGESKGDISTGTVDIPVLKESRDKNRRLSLHHNHPDNSPISEGDLRELSNWEGIETIWAHTDDASYRASIGIGTSRHDLWKESKITYGEKFEKVYDYAFDNDLSKKDIEPLLFRAAEDALDELDDTGIIKYQKVLV